MDSAPDYEATTKYAPVSYEQYSLSASALNIPINSAAIPASSLSPTSTGPTKTHHHHHHNHNHNHNQHSYPQPQLSSISSPLSSMPAANQPPEILRRASYPEPSRTAYHNHHHHQMATTQPSQSHQQVTSGPSSPVYSPPGLSMSTSVSAQSDIVSPTATTLPSPPQRKATEYSSPLEDMPEFAHVVIPPLCPPQIDRENDDWDSLPEILRQEPRADFTPRRPMNAYFIFMKLRRAQFANANPTFSTGELSKILGKEWSSMGVEKKAPWNDMYECLMKAFKAKFPEYQYERGGKRNKKRRSRSAPNSPQALLIRGEQPRGSMMTPRYAPYQVPHHYAVYPSHAHHAHYPVQQIHYSQEAAWAQQPQTPQGPPPPPYGSYAPVSHTHPGGMQPMVIPADQPAYPSSYTWAAQPAVPEGLHAPAPTYPSEPQWDEYIHH